jgi:hypothetical protein
MTIRLIDLAAWPAPAQPNTEVARHRLLAASAGRLGIVSRPPTATEWRLAEIPIDDLPALRAAVAEEGARTDRQPVAIAGGQQFRSIRRHKARTVASLLARIDAHLPEDDDS